MVPSDLFRDQPTLHGRGVRLVPLGAENADDFIQGIIDLDPDNAEVHYRIALNSMGFTGRGYGTAATDAVLEYAFETAGIHRVALEVFDFNTNARRSYEKSGFVREGVWRKHLRWDDAWHDAVLMSILDEEYALRSEHARP